MTFKARRQAIRTETDIVVALSRLRGDVLELGFSNYGVTRVVTAASELARNILKYAGSGTINYSKLVDGAKRGVEVVASDTGPGIADVDQALEDNFSSSGTLGMGLPGVKRMVDEFKVCSEVGAGTTVAFKVWKS
jgi:serine/threonine-protein kinase RsbT